MAAFDGKVKHEVDDITKDQLWQLHQLAKRRGYTYEVDTEHDRVSYVDEYENSIGWYCIEDAIERLRPKPPTAEEWEAAFDLVEGRPTQGYKRMEELKQRARAARGE